MIVTSGGKYNIAETLHFFFRIFDIVNPYDIISLKSFIFKYSLLWLLNPIIK